MKMSRQGPGALWKSNSWSTTAVAMVDTHSIAHCAALQAKGIKTPAPLLGHVSSLLLQWKLFVSVIVVPRIGGGGRKYWSKPEQRGEGAVKGQERISPFWGSPWEPQLCLAGFWLFQRLFSFAISLCVSKMLRYAEVNRTKPDAVDWVKVLYYFLSPDSGWWVKVLAQAMGFYNGGIYESCLIIPHYHHKMISAEAAHGLFPFWFPSLQGDRRRWLHHEITAT